MYDISRVDELDSAEQVVENSLDVGDGEPGRIQQIAQVLASVPHNNENRGFNAIRILVLEYFN